MQKSKFVLADSHRFAPSTTESYFNLEVRPTRDGHSGLFTLNQIPRGSIVGHDGGDVVSSVEDIPPEKRYAVLLTENYYLSPRDYDSLEQFWYLNHSCAPNIARIGGLVFVAKENIEIGSELTIDYAPLIAGLENWRMNCECNSRSCRGIISGNDWKNVEIAKSLWNEFLPHIQRKIFQNYPAVLT